MKVAPIPDNEAERVAALKALHLLDSPREVIFDRITRLASELLGTSISLLSLIDEDRQWFKSRQGTDLEHGERCSSFCGHAIMEDGVMVVRDAQRDDRFTDNPWVTGDPKIRFYAGATLRTSQGHAIGTLCTIDDKPRDDFDERQERTLRALADIAMAQIEMRASVDFVDTETGVYSRDQLLRVICGEARLARERGRDALLAVVDIALPRQMEDLTRVMGYDHAQDFVMESIARMADVIGRDRDLYRVGYSRFGFLIPEYEGPLTRDRLEMLAEALRVPFSCAGIPIKPHATVGIAELQGLTEADAQETVRMALVATDSAATEHKPLAFYDANYNEEQRRRYRTVADLPAALAAGCEQLSLVYQPKINTSSGRCESVEALLRWQHPELGAISPKEIIDAASNTELMPQITDWVLDQAIGQAAQWRKAGHALGIAVNVSARDVIDAELPRRVSDCLARHAFPAEMLDLEITEAELVDNIERARPQLDALIALGVTVSLDDFGTGYCNMHYLPQLPAQTIKLDGSLFRDLGNNQSQRMLTASLIRMARDLGYKVVAEGIADEDALVFAIRHGCCMVQGFHFSAGKRPDALESWLETGGVSAIPVVPRLGLASEGLAAVSH